MISLIVLAKRKNGMSKDQFREYYETNHVGLAKKHVMHLFQEYRRNYVSTTTCLANSGDAPSTDGPYDAITTIIFAGQKEFDEFFRIMSRPEIAAAFAADEAKFMDRSGTYFTIGENILSPAVHG